MSVTEIKVNIYILTGYIKCPYCERSFNQTTAVKHMAWCKEHLGFFGQPFNAGTPRQNSARIRDSTRQRGKEVSDCTESCS